MDIGAAEFAAVAEAARRGEAAALERLWAWLSPAVHGYLRLQGAEDPEDLTSEVFLRVFRTVDDFAGDETHFRSWVFTIAHHLLVDDRRRRSRHPSAQPDWETVTEQRGGDAEEEALSHLSEQRVRRLCQRLAPDQRDVLLLRMVAGLSLVETADALGKTSGAVKALQHRAVAALRRVADREAVSP